MTRQRRCLREWLPAGRGSGGTPRYCPVSKADDEVAVTTTAVPPLNGGTGDHDSETTHTRTVMGSRGWRVGGAARSAASSGGPRVVGAGAVDLGAGNHVGLQQAGALGIQDDASHEPVELAGAMEPLQLERTGVLKAQL